MVLITNTMISKIAFGATMLLFVSFSQYVHRSVWYAAGSSVMNYFCAISNIFYGIKVTAGENILPSKWYKSLNKLIIPLVIVMVFLLIYSAANTVLSNLLSNVWSVILIFFDHFFELFSLQRIGFFILGLLITAGIILNRKTSLFSDADRRQHDYMRRKKTYLKRWKESAFSDLFFWVSTKSMTGVLALKNENVMGIISLTLLNAILLLVNLLDVKYLWLSFEFQSHGNLSAYVHEGTNLLILSIVLSMQLLLFFFRGNLNFYRKNKWLKYGAYLWITQNTFLVLSVALRNYYYILHLGLAYKRIGLIFFLLMVLVGLITVFIKIYLSKSAYYLFRVNAWVVLILLVISSIFNWDNVIVKYNLSHKSTVPIDVPFLLSLSNSTLPLLQKNLDVLEKYNSKKFYVNNRNKTLSAVEFYEYRKANFLEEQRHHTWLSWNIPDNTAVKFFNHTK